MIGLRSNSTCSSLRSSIAIRAFNSSTSGEILACLLRSVRTRFRGTSESLLRLRTTSFERRCCCIESYELRRFSVSRRVSRRSMLMRGYDPAVPRTTTNAGAVKSASEYDRRRPATPKEPRTLGISTVTSSSVVPSKRSAFSRFILAAAYPKILSALFIEQNEICSSNFSAKRTSSSVTPSFFSPCDRECEACCSG